MLVATWLLLVLAAFGHAAFWVGVVNRWHATGWPRWVVKSVTLVFYAALTAPFVWLAVQLTFPDWLGAPQWRWQLSPATVYLALCAIYGVVHLGRWLATRLRPHVHPHTVIVATPRVHDVEIELGMAPASGPRTYLLGRLPGNQLWKLHISAATVALDRLPSELEGLSICHWSDLHLSGRIDREYFHEVVRLTNEMKVDVLALTGDICDKAEYIDWIPELFAGVKARLGKYFVLGNHDLRTGDVGRLRDTLVSAGFADLGGRVTAIAGGRMLLAGDERPWFKAAPQFPDADGSDPLRVLLAHTPDQLGWARTQGVQLMLAGHTHGGQVRFPVVGPVLCPSWHGTRYAQGYFYEEPTLLHVSRGTASLFPLRLDCPPEITRLELRRA